MKLIDTLKGISIKEFIGSLETEIHGIAYSSSEACRGGLFIALMGQNTDGHKYIEAALRCGVVALLVESLPESIPEGLSVVQVDDTRESLSQVAANFFSHPSKELELVGVTGTNGKTTVTYLLESIWTEAERNAGVIGTVEYRYSKSSFASVMTTPESLDLMKLLRDMRNSGVECVAMEVSSHALDMKRVLGCHFDAVVFTNLSQDHLDYHGSMDEYFLAKKRLFSEVLPLSGKGETFSVINRDDPYGHKIAKDAQGTLVWYSALDPGSTLYADKYRITEEGIFGVVKTPWGNVEIASKLFGKHNLYNILAAAASALSLGVSLDAVERGILKLTSVSGRLERVENSLGITILVDYAHTPDALRNVLEAVRPLTEGRLIIVFGCGGDRDPSKRPIMGRIAVELADVVVVTSDNPRTENPESIIDAIEVGIKMGIGENIKKEKTYIRIPKRKDAIREAVGFAKRGDLILIAGKGHEPYQILGTTRIPFDDREIARKAVLDLDRVR